MYSFNYISQLIIYKLVMIARPRGLSGCCDTNQSLLKVGVTRHSL